MLFTMKLFALVAYLAMISSLSSGLAEKSPSPCSEIRDFVRMTNLMQIMGVHVTIEHPNKNAVSKFGLLLGVEPNLLILLPQELMPNTKMENFNLDSYPLIILNDKIENLKLVCYNSRVQKYFPDWSIMEGCKPEIYNIFSAQIKDLSETSPRLAISRDDLENTAIVEIGKLACFPKPGQCRSPRPAKEELNSVLSLETDSLELTVAKTQLPGTWVIVGEGQAELSKTTSGVSSEVAITDGTLPINTLMTVPSYEDDPVKFELYKLREKQKTTGSTCLPTGVFWVKVGVGPDCITTSGIEEVGT